MLIGIDASRANRDHKSGTEWYSYYLIKALAKLDDHNQYILYSRYPLKDGLLDLTNDDPSLVSCDYQCDGGGYQQLISPHGNFRGLVLGWPFKFFWTLGRFSLAMLMKRPDVLFIPAHTLPFFAPRQAVMTIHDVGFKRQQQLYSRELIGYRSRWLKILVRTLTRGQHAPSGWDYLDWSTKRALKQTRKIITVSQFSKKELLEFYPREATEQKISVVYNGYNQTLYRPNLPAAQITAVLAKYGLERPFIFYVGRLEKKKNLTKLVEAYAMARYKHQIKHKLYLVGDAGFGYDEIKHLINELGVDLEVATTGWIEEGDMPYIFAAADAFIFPTKYEGFGIPLLQAMASETPIVASAVASVPEIAGEAALLFDPENVGELADKIAQVLLDNNLRQRLIERGRERVKNFSLEKCARETLEILENL